jgi:hypothetical protein
MSGNAITQPEVYFRLALLLLFVRYFDYPYLFGAGSCRDLGCFWKSLAPLKVIIFSWQLLLGRLPTKENLAKRGVGGNAPNHCVCCA